MIQRKTPIRARDFRAWFKSNLKDRARDIAEYGADAGYPHITYTSDTCHIFDHFADEIWEMASDDAESMGEGNVATFIGSFRRADMLTSWDGLRNLLVWYACEKVAREMMEARETEDA